MNHSLLQAVLLAEGAALTAGLVVLVAHAVRTERRRRRHDTAVAQTRRRVQRSITEAGAIQGAAAAVAALPLGLAIPVLLDLIDSVTGQARHRLHDVARLAGIEARARTWCRSRRWWRRLRGLRLLARLDGSDELIAALLGDPHPAVRAAAADAVSGHRVTPDSVDTLLVMLDDPDPACRFAAKSTLLGAGRVLIGALRSYLENPAAPRVVDALEIAVEVAGPELVAAAAPWSTHERDEIRARVAVLVAAAAGAGGIETLQRLLRDRAPAVRAAAATGLGALGHWPAAGELAQALEDRSWDVRLAAGLALRLLGPPGTLYLRRALTSTDPFAADMAHQMLDLPAGAVTAISA